MDLDAYLVSFPASFKKFKLVGFFVIFSRENFGFTH